VLAAVNAALMSIPEGWGAVKAEDLNVELVEAAPDLLIDVRTPAEWEKGYIPGAVQMPLEELMSFVSEWPEAQDADIVVYCQGGHRGQMAATMLRAYGYTNVRNLSGGFAAWATATLPVETP
jgi:rhodanese-related sulfurtransferase